MDKQALNSILVDLMDKRDLSRILVDLEYAQEALENARTRVLTLLGSPSDDELDDNDDLDQDYDDDDEEDDD